VQNGTFSADKGDCNQISKGRYANQGWECSSGSAFFTEDYVKKLNSYFCSGLLHLLFWDDEELKLPVKRGRQF
jgi:hypothetical protein